MSNPKLPETFSKLTNFRKHKHFLLNTFGYETIYQAKQDYPEKKADEIYKMFLEEYNLSEIKEEIFQEQQKQYNNFKDTLEQEFIELRQGVVEQIELNLNDLYEHFTLKEILDLVIKFSDQIIQEHVLLTIGSVSYTLSDLTRDRLSKYIQGDQNEEELGTSSDQQLEQEMQYAPTLIISEVKQVHTNEKANGAFFAFTHKLNGIDLSELQIYETFIKKNYEENCIIYALFKGGLEATKLETIKTFVKDRKIAKCKLNEICLELQIQIRLKQLNSKDKVEIYGKEFTESYNIGLLADHYFIIKPFNITKYAIENYEDIKDLKNWNSIIKKGKEGYKRSQDRFVDTFEVVKLLLENKEKLLNPLTFENSDIASSQFYDKVEMEFTNLEYIEKLGISHKAIAFTTVKEEKPKKKLTSWNIFLAKKGLKTLQGQSPEFCDEIKSEYEIVKDEIQTEIDLYELKKLPPKKIFFDFETYTDHDKKHIPYLCRFIDLENNEISFYGESCGYRFIEYLKTLECNILLIAHNAGYDFRFIFKNILILNEISKGSHFISCTGIIGKYFIEIKDSYNLITMPLRDFPSVFDIKDAVKEVMPYKLYNVEGNVKKRFIPLNECLSFIKKYQQQHFIENCKKWDCLKWGKVDIIKYSEEYCKIDCRILKEGYEKFREWMLLAVNIDIDSVLTIASLAHKYFINSGCYNGVFEISGVPQMFMQKCVVGGRTMMSDNKKVNIDVIINDFDAVSLYPSAMKRLKGFLKGLPKVITNLAKPGEPVAYEDIKNKDGYFVEIKPLSIAKNRKFSLMSYLNKETGVREFTNEIRENIFVDKIALEDLIEFQGLKFEIIRGYYFDEGFNTTINEKICYLFEERKKQKALKNPIELVYKLIMNSGYGKSLMKPVKTETKIFNNKEDYEIYLSRNYDWIKCSTKISNTKYKVEICKSLEKHFNIVHVGVSILSMSKRIMNEVMCLAEDNEIDIYYQDTDSMHLQDKDIDKLSSKFFEKYGRDLIGKEMGQFHSDFELTYYTDLNGNIIEDLNEGKFCGIKHKCSDVKSTHLITVGKKCYVDRLEGLTKEGKIIVGYHIRMKAIPSSCIDYTVKKENFEDPIEMFETLYIGKSIKFDLLEGMAKDMFKFNKDMTISTLREFERELSFR